MFSTSCFKRIIKVIPLAIVVLVALLASASPASASRAFDSALEGPEGGFLQTFGVAFDGNDNLWVVDNQFGSGTNLANRGLYKYDAYPSQTLLETPDMSPFAFGSRAFHIAIDQTTNTVYISQANSRFVEIFEHGAPVGEWAHINGVVDYEGIDVAVDNSNTESAGRIYLALTSPENDIEAFDAARRPVQFPATASYIEGNSITGTPSGPFGEVGEIAVDNHGNIYVSDPANKALDEFDSTGTFVRTFDGAGAPGEFKPYGVAVDPTNGNVVVNVETAQFQRTIEEFDSAGNFLGTIKPGISGDEVSRSDLAFNSDGYLYVPNNGNFSNIGPIEIYKPAPAMPTINYEPVSGPTTTSGTLRATVDPDGSSGIETCKFEYGTDTTYALGSKPCQPEAEPYSGPTAVSAEVSGLTTETTYHYRVVVTNSSGTRYGADQTYTPHRVVGLTTEAASDVTETGANLNGSLVGDGSDTHYYFEWGSTSAYGNTTPSLPGADLPSPSGPQATPLTASLSDLTPYSTYHYRVVATNGSGTSYGDDLMFTTPVGIPSIPSLSVSQVHSDRVFLKAAIDPNGAATSYHFEYVSTAEFAKSGWASATRVPAADVDIGRGRQAVDVSTLASGLKAGTVYHYRVVAGNRAGVGTPAADHVFTTFSITEALHDPCSNSHARQQTGASLLPDCRAYELVSAASTGGYDVESNLVSGQTPFGGYPDAVDASGNPEVLYGIHSGALSVGNPTNRGVDPYVATRGTNGWSTSYVGIPANDPFSSGPFASTLLEADAKLDTFAFGGPEICSPCFADGSSGVPTHLPNGELVQGMVGSESHPTAEPAGYIAKHLSADGSHLVFGSSTKLEPDGTEGEISIYDRDLGAHPPVTHVVSKTPLGTNLPCLTHCTSDGIGVLDISSDGSHILLGQLVSESEGRRYWHLYMNIGDSGHTIDVTPGAASGVLFDGMTADGSMVYFTSSEKLTPDDEDTSADIYRADVSGAGATLTRISTGPPGPGEPGNRNDCDPAANTKYLHWNTVGTEENCDVLAVGGGAGVASGDGTIFFLSPEKLDTSNPQNEPVENAPNLYVARPGSPPHFVRTLESSLSGSGPFPSGHLFRRNFGSFSGGRFMAVDDSGGPSSGDTYVAINHGETSLVLKFDRGGNLMTSWGTAGRITGAPGEPFGTIGGRVYGINRPIDGIAVDNQGTLYVATDNSGYVYEFEQDGTFSKKIAADSRFVNDNSGLGVDNEGNIYTYSGGFGLSRVIKTSSTGVRLGVVNREVPITGFGVDPVSGDVYINKANGGIYHYEFNSAGEVKEPDGATCPLTESGCRPTASLGHEIKAINSIAVDPTNHEVYADDGDEIVEFEPSGQQVGSPFGQEDLTNSNAIAVGSDHTVSVVNFGGSVLSQFGPTERLSNPAVDSRLVIDSLSTPETRRTTDFQVTPSGDDAVFSSNLPLTGYDSANHAEIFRYQVPTEELDCVSCNPTSEQATGNASLPSNGLGISDDGRVFFNSEEGLVDRDLNGLEDAYEWEPQGTQVVPEAEPCQRAGGCVDLISSGASPHASSMLSASADGTDAYFFTRDKLVEQDENGNTVKIYDARVRGGFEFVPPSVQCKASDECHGPGSPEPPPPRVTSNASTPESISSKTCRKGFVLKHGKCIRKPHKHRKPHRKHRYGSRRHG